VKLSTLKYELWMRGIALLTEILLIVGIGLALIGRINIGDLNVEGPPVRAAGFVLTIPFLSTLLLSFMVGVLFGDTPEAVDSWWSFVVLLQIPVIVICLGAAYRIIQQEMKKPSGEQTTKPQPRQQPQQNKSQQSNSGSSQSVTTPQRAPAFPVQPSRPSRDRFPSVMSLSEAARYLGESEQRVLDLIDSGKITAARINYRYRISRSVLDDFLEEQQGSAAE
jgi:excisionase family DNA binding protein